MKIKLLPAAMTLAFCSLFSNVAEFPEVIDFGNMKLFQESLLYDPPNSWSWRLGDSAFKLGYTAFNDSPEIATFITMLQRDYQIDGAIETGTFLGATTQYFSLYFNDVHTIEVSEMHYRNAKERLKSIPNIHCHFGSSQTVLKELLPSLKGKRLLFYLDAHAGIHDYWPILDELEEISKTHRDNCVIVIDDIHVPGTELRGTMNGSTELTHELVKAKLNKVFSKYDSFFLIPKLRSRAGKFVAIPVKWKNPDYNYQGRVDILSGFNIYDFPIQLKNVKQAGYDIQMQYKFPYGVSNSPFDDDLKKIIVFSENLDASTLSKLPKQKLVYFIMEPGELPAGFFDPYPYVYTWNDDLVDNVKFFKLHYPYLAPMRENLPSFSERRLCVMISGSDNEYPERKNELYSERMKWVDFFETKPPGEFDIYGRYWVKRYYRDFRGAIPGHHSGDEKITTLTKYRFCVCFENTKGTRGYITEKIFACFEAGCIPIYWGADNVTDYIPKNCFIDFRDFRGREEVYQYIKTMSKATYEGYLSNIRSFLKSDKAQVFSPAHFEQTVLEAITK